MANIVKKVFSNSGLFSATLPGTVGNAVVCQIDVHGAGGGGTQPIALQSGSAGGFGGHIAGMFKVPGGSTLGIGVGSGGGVGVAAMPYQTQNGGNIVGFETSYYRYAGGGDGGMGGQYGASHVGGGGGGAMSTVCLKYPNSSFTEGAKYWPFVYNNDQGAETSWCALIWAGGGGGAAGALNNGKAYPYGGVTAKSGEDVNFTRIYGRSYYYYSTSGGTIMTRPNPGYGLSGSSTGGGGTGGAADYTYGEVTSYEYATTYFNNGAYTSYYGTSATGGRGGKSGLNMYWLTSDDWYETPETYPGGSTAGNYGAGSYTYSQMQYGYSITKRFIASLSQYGYGGAVSKTGGVGRVTVRYEQLEGQPNELDTFLSEYDAEINTYYITKNTVTVLGINVSVPATVDDTDSRIIVNGILYTGGQTVQVTNGAVLSLRTLSPQTYNTNKSVYLYVGSPGVEVSSKYLIVTKQTPPSIPNDWDFTDVNNALPNTFVTSESVEISGIATGSAVVNISASDSATGTPYGTDKLELIINNIKKETLTGVILNGQPIKVRVKSSSTPGDVVTVLITIGDGSTVDWTVTTIATIDTGPEFYNFTNITDAEGGVAVESNTVVISGINYTAGVTATAKVIGTDAPIVVYASVNGENWKNLSTETVTIENQQTLKLKLTPPNTANTTVQADVIVGTNSYGSLSDIWKVTTSKAGDIIPDFFAFTDRVNQKSTSVVYSNTVLIKGITSPAPLSITIPADFTGSQPQFSIDGGVTWYNITGTTQALPAPQTISNNTGLMLKLKTAGYGSNSSIIKVDIGGVIDEWAVSTLPEAPVSDQSSTWYSQLTKADGYSIGTVISIFRDSTGSFGVLDGSPESRYPGFIECIGQTLNANDYPELFNVLQNTYGGNGTKSEEPPYEYTGTFKLPDYRNRKLYGSGKVDSNISSSPSVPVMFGPDGLQGGTPTTVGSQGGWWFIDTIDASGPYPREQIYDDEVSGEFFKLGTLKTTGYTGIKGQTGFIITGDCLGEVGPIKETIVKTPSHTHEFVSSQVVDAKTGLIAWGSPGILPGKTNYRSNTVSGLIPGASNLPSQGNIFDSDIQYTYTFNNYWASDKVNTIPLNNSNSSDAPGANTLGGSAVKLGAIDVKSSPCSVLGFSAGGTLTHSHYISKNPVSSASFSYGNVNGFGTKYGSPSGLSETVNLSFSAASLALSSDLGTFTLSSSKSVNPTAKFKPNETVPLITKYYKAKYIIKAF